MIFGRSKFRRMYAGEDEMLPNGDIVPGAKKWGEEEQCDYEPAKGEGSVVVLPDGKKVHYSYILTLDWAVTPFQIGDKIMLRVPGYPPTEYVIKGYQRYTYIAKAWV